MQPWLAWLGRHSTDISTADTADDKSQPAQQAKGSTQEEAMEQPAGLPPTTDSVEVAANITGSQLFSWRLTRVKCGEHMRSDRFLH